MKLLIACISIVTFVFPMLTKAQGQILVRAVVRELKHDPNSAPLEWRNIPGKEPPVWTASLEIEQVLRGNEKLEGERMITGTADSHPTGNWYVVTPRLNIGDQCIFAIKQLSDENETWAAVYGGYELEKDLWLPLIKGRDEAYEKVLQRFSGGEPSKPTVAPVKPEPPRATEPEPEPEVPDPAPPPAPKPRSSIMDQPWFWVAGLLVAIGFGWVLVRKKK